MNKLLLSFFILGFTFGIGPCLVSCGPLLFCYIAGTHKCIARSAWAYLIFSFSRILVYLVLGFFIFRLQELAQHLFGAWGRYFFLFGGIFISVIGILMAIGQENKFCHRLKKIFINQDTKTLVLFGLILGFLPCAPLVSVLSYVALIARNWADSLLYSLFFGLGTAVSPLLLLVIFGAIFPKFMVKFKKFMRYFNYFCAAIVIILGIQLARRFFT